MKKMLDKDNILLLILKKKWKAVNKIICSNDCCLSQYTLNFALRYKPPLYIVQRITEKCYGAQFERDCMGRYPLLVALKYGTTPDVVRYLTETNEDAAKSQDIEAKTPLHHLFYEYYDYMDYYDISKFNKFVDEIIDILCHYGPESVIKEDENGVNVIECAIERQVDIKKVKRLQNEATCIHLCKRDSFYELRKY